MIAIDVSLSQASERLAQVPVQESWWSQVGLHDPREIHDISNLDEAAFQAGEVWWAPAIATNWLS